jgi:hypothetical protein
MKRSILIFLLVSLVFGCSKEDDISYSSDLIGQWDWLMTCGGFSGLCGTPQSSHKTAKIIFGQDSIFYSYQNDTLVSSHDFSIIKKQVDYYFGTLLIDNRYFSYFIIHDTLNFGPTGADFSSLYKRIK